METRSSVQLNRDITLNALIDKAMKDFDKTKKSMILHKIFNKDTSNSCEEKVGFMYGGGLLFPKLEGQVHQEVSLHDGDTKTFTHMTFGLKHRVTMEARQDDKFKVLTPAKYTTRAVNSTYLTFEYSMAGNIDGGHSTTLTADGYSLFNASHPIPGTGLTFSNTDTPASLSETSIKAGMLNMERTLSPDGYPTPYIAMMLLIPPELYDTAKIIIKSDKRAGTSDNDMNTLKDQNIEILKSPYLSSTTAYSMYASKDELDNKFYIRMEPLHDSWIEKDTKDEISVVTCRFSLGWVDWRGAYGNQGA